jgi:LasA protease
MIAGAPNDIPWLRATVSHRLKESAMLRSSCITGLRRTSASIAWLICAAVAGCTPTSPANDETSEEPSSESQGFIVDFNYSYDEMLAFDVEKFCSENAPHLMPHAELISHVAGKRRVSPRVLIALMEQQSQAISNSASSVSGALGGLSEKNGLREQLEDLSARIRSTADLYGNGLRVNVDSPASGIMTVIPAEVLRQMGKVYQGLFPGVVAPEESAASQALTAAIPMQFPFPVDKSWYFGGAHADNGSGFPFSSLDFYKGGEDWGSTITETVRASAGGTVKKHSSCFVEVIHSGQWSTGYYHMGPISVTTGTVVTANQSLGKYANSKSQALCDGGDSTGPHVHWSLYSSQAEASLSGMVLSGWKISVGTSNYDENCNRMYLTKDGVKKCASTKVLNGGIPDQCPNDPKKKIPGVCGCGKAEPTESSSFKDAYGYSCFEWQGYDCTRAQEDDGYTAAQETSLVKNCPLTCRVCPY